MKNINKYMYNIHNSKGIKKYVIFGIFIVVLSAMISTCSGGCDGHSSCNSSSCSTTSNIIEM